VSGVVHARLLNIRRDPGAHVLKSSPLYKRADP
jgi:hypothetical protein